MKEKNIHILMERFFEGRTSKTEERELYAWFRREDMPKELEKYKPLFGYFEEWENGKTEEWTIKSSSSRGPKQFMRHSRLLYTISTIAASFAIIIGLCIYKHFNNNSFNPYKGSYIIRNGVKITDPKIIRPEIEKSLFMMAMQNEIDKREMQKIDF
jgi:hypothetical protein